MSVIDAKWSAKNSAGLSGSALSSASRLSAYSSFTPLLAMYAVIRSWVTSPLADGLIPRATIVFVEGLPCVDVETDF